ncbi:unknown [Firmicutes bacterium CAG:137]|nr:unknown [Firmicutes bacterium CAG:137]
MVFSTVGFLVFSMRSIRCWMDMARRYRVRLLMPQPFIRSRVKPNCLSLACSCSYCFICKSNRACFSSM